MPEEQIILLVDDDENDLLLTELAFRKADFNASLQIVRDGEEAVAYLEGQFPYDDGARFPLPTLLLLDLNMPRKDGFEVIEWVRAQPTLKHLPIIVLTASMHAGDVGKAFDLGANSFLVKPARLDDLVVIIRTLRDWLKINLFPPLQNPRCPSATMTEVGA